MRWMPFVVSAEQKLLHLDSSALVKLVRREPQTVALAEFVNHAELISSTIVLAEIPRAIRRALSLNPRQAPDRLFTNASVLLKAVGLVPLSQELLAIAGAIPEPDLRSLDAIHVASAAAAAGIEAFVTYDERQRRVAERIGLMTASVGA